jgi:hypothetical protein
MIEKDKSDVYMRYLNQILAGEKDIGFTEDEEIKKLLILSRTMIDADLSAKSKLRESLGKKLLTEITKKLGLSGSKENEDELNEEDLSYVTAGYTGRAGEQNDICPYCGSKLKRLGGKCPICHH